MKLYHKTKGEPSRKQITNIATKLDLKEIQVYKWMWDTQKRQDRNTQELLESKYPFTTIFNIDHKDGKGNDLTPYQVQFALELYKETKEVPQDQEVIAKMIGIELETKANELVGPLSELGTRQTIQRMDAVSENSDMPFDVSSSGTYVLPPKRRLTLPLISGGTLGLYAKRDELTQT